MENLLIIGGIGIVLALVTLWGLLSRYKKCPANKMLVVYGKTGKDKVAKCLNGGGTFVWPVIQGYSFMDLTPMQFTISLQEAPSKSYIPVSIDSNVTIQISPEPNLMQTASINLLGLGQAEIIKMVREIVLGCVRNVIARMEVEELNEDRDKFKYETEITIKSELEKIGIKLTNLTIAEITDKVGYIAALGKQSAEKALNEARVKVAEQKKFGDTQVAIQEKEKEISVSETEKERATKTAEIRKEKEVTISSTQKDLDIQTAEIAKEKEVRKAEIEKDTLVGVANTIAEQEISVAEATTQKEVGVADAVSKKEIGVKEAQTKKEIGIAEAEKLKRIEVAKANSDAKKGEFDAEQKVVTASSELAVLKAKAEQAANSAEVVSKSKVKEDEFIAKVSQEEARGKAIEEQLNADLIIPAEIQKKKLLLEAEAEAESNRIKAKGEADSLLMVKKAEADGKQKSLEADAEGFKKMIEAAGTNPEMAIQYLMVGKVDILAERQAEAMKAIHLENVTLFDSSKGAGVGNFVNNLMQEIAPTLNMAKTLNMGKGLGEIKKQITDASKSDFDEVK